MNISRIRRSASETDMSSNMLRYLAHDLSIGLEAVVSEKMTANERKYPPAKSYGSNKKYTDL
jgi:hypothetical protein